MLEIWIKTKTGTRVSSRSEALDELPNDTVEMSVKCDPYYWSDEDEPPISTNTTYETLTRMVKNFPRRLPSITIEDKQENLAPDYLSFLVATFNNTESLRVAHTISHAAEMCCLMASLAPVHNLQELHLPSICFNDDDSETHCMTMLLQGIAISSLVNLTLPMLELNSLGDEIAKALKTNQTLKTLHLDLQWDNQNDLMNVLSTITKCTKIDDLSLFAEYDEGDMEANPNVLTEEVWVGAFCHPQCKIEKLKLFGIRLDAADVGTSTGQMLWDANTAKNTSIKFLSIEYGYLSATTMKAILQRFRCIQTLQLNETGIDTISHFQSYLLQDDSPLQFLAVEECESWHKPNDKETETFLRNLPNMPSLRSLNLRLPSFYESETCNRILKNVLPHTTLEKLVYTNDILDEKDAMTIHLNRGGRGKLRNEASGNAMLPSNLWPHILERAGKITYFDFWDHYWKHPSLESRRVDVVYWLLRETPLLAGRAATVRLDRGAADETMGNG